MLLFLRCQSSNFNLKEGQLLLAIMWCWQLRARQVPRCLVSLPALLRSANNKDEATTPATNADAAASTPPPACAKGHVNARSSFFSIFSSLIVLPSEQLSLASNGSTTKRQLFGEDGEKTLKKVLFCAHVPYLLVLLAPHYCHSYLTVFSVGSQIQ